jgi:uncharacterized membrane protein
MSVFAVLIPLALAAVTLTLFVGVFALFKGGEFGRRWSNRLMRLRVALQFAAILIILTAVVLAHHGST